MGSLIKQHASGTGASIEPRHSTARSVDM